MNKRMWGVFVGVLALLGAGLWLLVPRTESQVTHSPQRVSVPVKAAASRLSLEALKNASYAYTDSMGMHTFVLRGGVYQNKYPASGRPEDYQTSIDAATPLYYGDLDGDGVEETCITLVTRTGGMGTERSIYIFKNDNGKPTLLAQRPLGDGVKIGAISIKPGSVDVELGRWNAGEYVSEQHHFSLSGMNLVEAPKAPMPAAPTTTAEDWRAYKNARYGFSLTLTKAWRGYRVLEKPDTSVPGAYSVYFQLPLKDKSYGDGSGFANLLAIGVYPKSVWQKLKATGQTPLEDYITENRLYVFTAATWQDPPAELQNTDFEFQKVLSSFVISANY